ncbi:hypothetical protein J437_LFUL015727, partial [Ladona fulva]
MFQLGINEKLVTANFTLESSLFLHTNVSKLSIPLLCYNGRLKKVILPFDIGSNTEELVDEINFGLVGSGRKMDSYFAVVNENPVEIRLKSWGTNLSSSESGEAVVASVELAGLVLKPHQYAVFKIAATASTREGWLKGIAFVETQFERLSLSVKMRSAKGSLDVLRETLVFDECFPGKLCEQPLEVVSSFEVPMVAKSVITHPPDSRVTFFPASVDEGRKCGAIDPKPSSNVPLPSICPHGTSLLGHLTFNPKAACGDRCYLGVSAAHKGGNIQWAQSATVPVHTSSPNVTPPASLPSHIAESDSALVDLLHSRFTALSGWQNVSLRLDTSEARRVAFKAAARLVWPRLLWWKGTKCPGNKKTCSLVNTWQDIRFPLTHVANTSILEVSLENPSDSPLLMQLALQYAYPQAKRVLDLLPRSLQPPPNEGEEATSPEEFRFVGVIPNPHWQWGGPALGVGLPTSGPNGLSSSQASGGLLPLLLLQPKKSLTVQLAFKPIKASLSSTLIFIRNNLTALEVVRVSGQGGYAQFRFGNRKPGNPSPLLFELTEKHLKDCERETPWKYSMPNLTVKRSFTARNTGDLPVYVTGLDIDGLPCEGYGFRILSCGPFEMPANGTHKVEIAFTPDFTLSKVQRVLRIHSGGGAVGSTISNYTMLASLPTYMLAPCSSVLPRPSWESKLYLAVILFSLILLLIVVAAAFFESDRILKCTLVAMASSAAAAAAVSSPAANTCPTPVTPVNMTCSSHQAWTHPTGQNHSEGRKRDGQGRGSAPFSTSWVGVTNRDRHINEEDVGLRGSEVTESASSKGKKKLGRRNGGFKTMQHAVASALRVDRIEIGVSPSRSAGDTCLLEVPKETGKRNGGKGGKLLSEGACSEEETCSTTTESSNNEEIEKTTFQENDSSSRQSKDRSKEDSNRISLSPIPSVITSTKHCKVPSPVLPNSRSSSNESSAPSPILLSSSASSSSSSSPPADFRDNYEGDCDDEDDYALRDDKTLGAALRAAERSCELSVPSLGTGNIGSVPKSKGASAQTPKAIASSQSKSSSEINEVGKSRGGGDSQRTVAPPSLELPYKPKPLKSVGRKESKGLSLVVTAKRRLGDIDHTISRPVPPPPPRQVTPPPPPTSSPLQSPPWDPHRMRSGNHTNDSPSPPILYSNVVSSSGERQYPTLGPAVSRPSAIPATRPQVERQEETSMRKKSQSRGRAEDSIISSATLPSMPMAPGSIPRGMLGPIGRGAARPRPTASSPQVAPSPRLPPAWATSLQHRSLTSQGTSTSIQSLQSSSSDSHLFGDNFAKSPLKHESFTSQVNNVGYVGDNLNTSASNKAQFGSIGGSNVLSSGRNVWEQQSIMKVLQEERRKRVEEHQRINILKAESLWDPIYPSSGSIQSGLEKDQHIQKEIQPSSSDRSESPWSGFGNRGVWSSSVWTSSEGSTLHAPSAVDIPSAQTHSSLSHHPPGIASRQETRGLSSLSLSSRASPPGIQLPPVNNVGYVGDNLNTSASNKAQFGSIGGSNVLSSGRNVWEQQSIMKVLQEERRKRVEEHQRINILKAESLWDPIYPSSGSIQSGLEKDQHIQKEIQPSSSDRSESPWSGFGNRGVWSSSVWTSSEGSTLHAPSAVDIPSAQTHSSLSHHPPGIASRQETRGLSSLSLSSRASPPGIQLPPVTPLSPSTGFESLTLCPHLWLKVLERSPQFILFN